MKYERSTGFAVRSELARGVHIVAVSGEVDIANKAVLAAALASAPDRVLVDLSAVRFMDSSGLAALVGAQQHRNGRGGRLAVILPAGSVVQRLLELSGVEGLFDAYPDRAQALDALARLP